MNSRFSVFVIMPPEVANDCFFHVVVLKITFDGFYTF